MYSPDIEHEKLFSRKPLLTFDESRDFYAQKKALKSKLSECLGDMPERVPLAPLTESITEYENYTEHRISFDTEENVRAVCLLCLPKTNKEKYPLVLCLQGHSTGMHNSVGRKLYPGDDSKSGDRDFAIQAVEHGFAALCLEQRGMGERRTVLDGDISNGRPKCHVTSMNALLLGRTMIGERMWDISRAIDLALTYPMIDGEKIACTGNSGGGTVTFYAACMDERIKAAMPSCSFCTYKDSIGAMNHCVCNFIPGIAKYADMGDLAAAIAPRKLIIINGKNDPIFHENGVLEAFETVKKIYRCAGVPENCILATGDGEHRYYREKVWNAFDTIVGW